MEDDKLCKALEGRGEVFYTFSVFCIKRGDYLLLALPEDRKSAQKTLALYHPQSFKARMLIWVVASLVALNLHRILPQRKLRIRESGPLAKLRNSEGHIGFLLGNAEADARRAIVVHPADGKTGGYVVDKIGLGAAAKKSVIDERVVIESLPKNNAGLPQICDQGEADGWAFYTTPYLHGHSPRGSDQEAVLELLKIWAQNAVLKPLHLTRQWTMMREAASGKEARMLMLSQLEALSDLKIKVGLFHGDFAPWNLKISSDKSFLDVMDWESGSPEGPAGWDGLHYIIQVATLVDRLSAAGALKRCRDWAGSQEGRDFLEVTGWGQHGEVWIGSYLMYSSWVAGYEREELLEEWNVPI